MKLRTILAASVLAALAAPGAALAQTPDPVDGNTESAAPRRASSS